MLKVCKTCNIRLHIKNFSKDKNSKDGLDKYCKKCLKKIRDNRKDKQRESARKYYLKNKDLIIKKSKKYQKNNWGSIKKYRRNYMKERRLTDPVFKLNSNTRTLIGNSFRQNKSGIFRKNSKTSKILGCTILEFKNHIETKFKSWMSWENYGKYNGEYNFGWDLDHIIPVSSAKTEEELIKLNHYSNFQPLCSKINRDEKISKQ